MKQFLLNKFFQPIMKNTFFKFFKDFILPLIFILVVSFSINLYYANYLQHIMISNSSKILSSISYTINNSLYTILQTTSMLRLDKNLNDIISAPQITLQQDSTKITSAITLLTQFKSTQSYIDSINIYNKNNGTNISNSGLYPSTEYYTDFHNYDKFNLDFWLNLKVPYSGYKILPPSKVHNKLNEQTITVLPIVQVIGSTRTQSSNILIIDINEISIRKYLEDKKITPNTDFMIMMNDGSVFSSTSTNSEFSYEKQADLISMILSKGNGSFIYSINRKKNFIITEVPNDALFNNFLYVAIIPLTDVLEKSDTIKFTVNLLLFACLAFGIFFSYAKSKNLYRRLRNLVESIDPVENTSDSSNEQDDFNALSIKINNVLNNNKSLLTQLSSVMPLVCEQRLLQLLNSSGYHEDKNLQELLEKNGVYFIKKTFLVSIIDLDFTKDFYDCFNSEQQTLVYNGILHVIKNLFATDYFVYLLNIKQNKLCMIINLESEEIEGIMAFFHQLTESFSYDKNLLQIYIGIGKSHKGFQGMHQSYKEAQNAVSFLTHLENQHINVYEQENTHLSYIFTNEDENKLFNYLMGGSDHEVRTLLQDTAHVNRHISTAEMRQLYLRLYNTGLRVLNTKKLSPMELMQEKYVDISAGYNYLEIEELSKYLLLFFDKLSSIGQTYRSSIDVEAIISYINTNSNQEIYLESIANIFHTSPKYLSRLLKQKLGIPFHQYLSNLRITNAKRLLAETNKTSTEIAQLVGFNNRNSFIRSFKSAEGVTPIEYRNMRQ